MARVTKSEAGFDLRLLGVISAASNPQHTKKSAASYNKLAAALQSVVNWTPASKQDISANQKRVVKSMMRMGAAILKKAA